MENNLLLQLKIVSIHTIMLQARLNQHILFKGRRGRDHIVIGLTTNPVDIIICVLFVGRGQSITCDNFLSNPIAVLFAIE